MMKLAGSLFSLIVIVFILTIVVVPWAFLFGINLILDTMGYTVIPITIKSWLGAFIVLSAMKATVTITNNKKG